MMSFLGRWAIFSLGLVLGNGLGLLFGFAGRWVIHLFAPANTTNPSPTESRLPGAKVPYPPTRQPGLSTQKRRSTTFEEAVLQAKEDLAARELELAGFFDYDDRSMWP